ncbi:MFS transporter [Actinoalloteichus caeruleus]|uniref:MFS transporter n=2 Tax=Actinoalloteichus cyanogriseus TaxID=2893586 RepID=UPI0004C1C878|nr:MFS transporter [Actinoalloteichus caeruleus]
MPLALLALAVGAFGLGTTEFVMMGLLPEIAAGNEVSIPTAGHLISGYALGVVIGAPALTAVGARLPRKTMLLGTMALFTASNLVSALAPNHETLLATRVLAGLPHGTFFGVGAVVAASLVAREHRAKAVSMMFAGLTLANVVGVPLGTLLGQQVGWRWTFVMVGLVGAAALVSVAALVPRQPAPRDAGMRRELGAFRRPQVWLALGIVTFGFGGTFACFSYITPMMTDVAGYDAGSVTWLLALFGVGMTIGNLLGGRLADRALMPSLYGFLAGLALMLGLFAFTAHDKVLAAATIFLIGVTGFAAGPTVQTLILDRAEGAPSLAAASIQSAFNIANAIGAYLGGLVISAGLGLTAPNLVGAGLAVVGLGIAVVSGVLARRENAREGGGPTPSEGDDSTGAELPAAPAGGFGERATSPIGR